jgi:hypothetical protein
MSNELIEILNDLPDYLKHERADVREQSLTILKGCSATEEYQLHLRKLDFIKPLLAAINDTIAISQLAQTCLVNIATDEVLRERIIEEGGIDSIMECLLTCSKKGGSPRLLLMCLTNLTTSEDGVSRLMQEGKSFQGLHAIRLVNWFCNEEMYQRSVSTGLDGWSHCTGVVANLSQSEAFRKLFVESNRGFLEHIKWQFRALLNDPTSKLLIERVTGILRVIHNVAYDNDKHYHLLCPDNQIFGLLLLPILSYNHGAMDEDDISQMPADIRELIANPILSHHKSKEMRTLVLQTLLSFCRNGPARKLLRASNIYFIVRELHKYLREVGGDDENDEFIDDDLIQYFLQDEAEEEGHWEDELKFALLQLKRQADGLDLLEKRDDIDERAAANVALPSNAALLEPTEDGQIMDAKKYNDERQRLHDEEEQRLEAAMAARPTKEYEYKASILDFL